MMPYDLERYSDEEIKAEIFRLRNELNYLKATIQDRNRESAELNKEMVKTQEAIGVLYRLVEKVGGSIEGIDDGLSSLGRELQECIHEASLQTGKTVSKRADEIIEYVEHDESIGYISDLTDRIEEMNAIIMQGFDNSEMQKINKKVGRINIIAIVSAAMTVLSFGLLVYFVMAIV